MGEATSLIDERLKRQRGAFIVIQVSPFNQC